VLKEYATTNIGGMTQGNSIVASICPKDMKSDPGSPGYGYNPAVAALITRLKEKLKGSCLPRPLTVNPDGTLPCRIVEALAPGSLNGKECATFCTDKGRDSNVTPELVTAVQTEMSKSKICGTAGGTPCAQMCLCLLNQEAGNDLAVCQNDPDGPTTTALPPGYCYVDPANGAGNNTDLVAKCDPSQARILRFVGNNAITGIAVPLAGAYVFTACQGSAISN
jgi:hypothetical protein